MESAPGASDTETPKKHLDSGLCRLCAKFTQTKRRVKIRKYGEETETSKLIENVLREKVEVGYVCISCLNKARRVDNQICDFVKCSSVVKDNVRTKRQHNSPETDTKRHVLSDISNSKSGGISATKHVQSASTSKPLPNHKAHRSLFNVKSVSKVLVNASTQTDDETEQDARVELVIKFPNVGRRTYKVPQGSQDVVRQAVIGSSNAFARAVLNNENLRPGIMDELGSAITEEVSGLTSKSNPSLLRESDASAFKSFDWKTLHNELLTRAPTLLHFMTCAATNPRQKNNKMKTGVTCLPVLLLAMSMLINLFCDELNCVKKMVSVVLKRGGAKKRLFKTFSALNMCMSYQTTNTMFKDFGKDFDKKILQWKRDVEEDNAIEKDMIAKIEVAAKSNNEFEKKIMDNELEKCRKTMSPGYQFVGDNVDFVVKVRHMSTSHRNKDHHLFHAIAYKNRLSGNHLNDTRETTDLKQFALTELLPSPPDSSLLVNDFSHHILHIWAKHIPAVQFCLGYAEPHIQHPYLEQTKKATEKVRLGVMAKNECKIDDMVDICQFLHQYVPGHSTESTEQPVKCLSGGDYLTFERHKKAQSTLQDSRTPSERLMGLLPKFEEFHTQAEVNKVVWTLLYDTASTADIGTLYAARNAIDARNVTKDPGDNFYAASALLDKYTEAL